MSFFRKISFSMISLAVAMLVLHAVVPHHHSGDMETLCVSPSTHHLHPHSNSCEQHHDNCFEQRGCDTESVCLVSHSYLLHSSDDDIVVPLTAILTHSQPNCEANCSHCKANYAIENAPILEKYLTRNISLRAPPVAC